jgi:hypothetical protein
MINHQLILASATDTVAATDSEDRILAALEGL